MQWFSWVEFLSPFKYSYDACLRFEFDRRVQCDGSGVLENACRGQNSGFATSQEVYDFLDVQGSVGFNISLLFVIFVVFRLWAYAALRYKKDTSGRQ